MNSTIIKMLIALLPTAPVVGEFVADYESNQTETSKEETSKNESTETIEDIQEKLKTLA